MNKIICPVDFSETSLNALEYAVAIGRKFRSTITLLHVFTESDFNKILDEHSIKKSFKERLSMAEAKLRSLSETINIDYRQDKVQCDYQLELGDLVDSILESIKNGGYDLCVMGTTGISKASEVMWGSNTEDVIEKAKIPVLCVPDEATFKGFTRLVYASDFMKEDKMAIQSVISFATIFDARISVLHINTGNSDKEYKEFIDDLKSFIQYHKINFVNKEFKDEIGLGIQEFMQTDNSDLLVVFKKQRSLVGSIFHKSITKTVSHSSDRPLLVLKLA